MIEMGRGGGGWGKERRQTSKQANQNKPRRLDLLPSSIRMHNPPYSGDFVLALFLLRLLVRLCSSQQLLEPRDNLSPVLHLLVMKQSRLLVDIVAVGIVVRPDGLLNFLHQLTDRLVGLCWHQDELDNDDGGGDDQVGEEETLVAESFVGLLVDDAVDEEQSARGIEGTRQEGEDQARVLGEGVG